ncbi:hypothetical protein CHLNCDRAFT_54290 [Chlorella variabilis]|uniref:G-patch domain-containing protein n=1 Tax=Chlorella variabilis TaxID=554065 RepID=E1ZNB2_CHLVA|nr:hypothetical protein CHLNCDRAFT_54290 [Chlorella variabilis]EFN52654.1 hypothetical protein CHLNCDRAFT_54290 [Chlorella variabilis]|eukprot:XP_005844756.1 hypothetical protein CHLNCDRAFT_54290 [Chlorella variabilis]
MNFKRQQGRPEFVGAQKPATARQASGSGSGGAASVKKGQAVASFYASLVNTSEARWVSGGTLQDGGETGGSGPAAVRSGDYATTRAVGGAAAAAPPETGEPSHAGLGSAAARAEQEAEERQLQYNQPAGPWPRGEQPAAAGGAEQAPPPRQQQQELPGAEQAQAKQRRAPREGIRYGISRTNVGYQLLKKAGWAEGSGLGAQEQGVAEPVAAFQQKGNLGLGYAPRPQPKAKQQGGAAGAAGAAAAGQGGAAAGRQQQQQLPKRPLPEDPLDKEDTETKVKRVRQVMQAEADDKAGKAIARYMHMAFNETTGEPTRDSNPLLRRSHKLSATNPLLHRTVPLVCQRWNQAAHSPPLLRSLSASIDGHSGKRFRRRLQSLCGWLRQVSAAHVRELRLTVQPRGPRLSVKRHRRLTEQQLQDCAAELADSLAACSRLEALDLSLGFEYDLSRCVAPLHSLRRLDTDALSGCDAVRLSESLGHLTALEHLRLDVGEELDIDWQDPSIHLPPFLTSLEVANDAGIETRFSMDLMFPVQIGDLSRLCSPSLINCIINVDTYTPLTRLTTLRRLNLLHCYGIPACLHQLTTLHSLAVVQTEQYNDQRDDDFARVEQALPHLQQLTFLELDGYPNVPTTLSSLQHLRSLWLTPAWDDEALPTGPWQASLRELGASPNLIALSLPALATAQQLEVLEVLGAGLIWLVICVMGLASKLRDAAGDGDEEAVRQLLAAGAPVDQPHASDYYMTYWYSFWDTARCLLRAAPAVQPSLGILLQSGGESAYLYANLAACLPLSREQWHSIPAPSPDLARALPAVLERSAAEAGWLVGLLAEEQRARLRAAALSLAWAQQQSRTVLPAELSGRILALYMHVWDPWDP